MSKFTIVAATGCPTGIAHTYMAQEALEQAAKKAGVQIKVETHVSASSRIEQLTPINFEHFRSQTCSGDVSYGS